MEKKPKFKVNMEKITSGISIQETVKSIDGQADSQVAATKEIRNYKRIPYKKLKPSPLNDYPIENIEEMENLLLVYGLLEPLNVSYIEDEDIYAIENGERRFRGLINLFEKFEGAGNNGIDSSLQELYTNHVHPLYTNGIYCLVENGPTDDDSIRSRIIIHNETNRQFDPIRTSQKLAELSDIYSKQNKSLPASERINVNQRIAQDLNGRYGVRQIIRYKNFDALADELKNVAVKNNLNISQVSTYHSLSETEQKTLARYLEDCYATGKKAELPTPEDLKTIMSETYEELEYQPEDTSTPAQAENTLQELKNRAARKIIESKDRKDTKIKATMDTIKKKSNQFEKAVLSYIAEQNASLPDVEEILHNLEDVIDKLNSIKQTIEGGAE